MTWKIYIFIYLGISCVVLERFQAISCVFQGYFKIISIVFQCDSWVCNGCAKGGLRAFLSNWVSIGSCLDFCTQKLAFFDKNIVNHPWNTPQIHLNLSGNTHEMTLKPPQNTFEIPLKPPPKHWYVFSMSQWLSIIRKIAIWA